MPGMNSANLTFIAFLVVLISVLAALLLVWSLRHWPRISPTLPGTSDVEGATVTVIGGIYGIVMAFMIFAAWTEFDNARNAVQQEAKDLTDLYWLAEALPLPLRDELQQNARRYAGVMIYDEWPAMQRNEISWPAWAMVDRMWATISGITPARVPDDVLRDHLLTIFTEMTDDRRFRLYRADFSLPGILWGVLIFGGALTVVLSAIYRVDPYSQHLVKTGVLAALISFTLLAIWELDTPYQGVVRISPKPFQQALQIMERNDRQGAVPEFTAGWESSMLCR